MFIEIPVLEDASDEESARPMLINIDAIERVVPRSFKVPGASITYRSRPQIMDITTVPYGVLMKMVGHITYVEDNGPESVHRWTIGEFGRR